MHLHTNFFLFLLIAKVGMKHTCWTFLCLLFIIHSHLAGGVVEEKTEVMMPGGPGTTTTTLSPPEGNTTFLDGTTWCVAVVGVSHADLQNALDWACGMGLADCRPILNGGPCYEPDNIVAHASYAFNSYYQQNGNSDIACNFGGTATITKHDPSYEKCSFATSGPTTSGVAKLLTCTWWKFTTILLLFYLGR